ncbi:hypothetical protein D3C71_624480 [compost metagenome]
MGVKPVSTSVPRGVSMVTGVVPRFASSASVSVRLPTVTLRMPSLAETTIVPVVRSRVSGPAGPSTSPRSCTSACPVAAPLPSTAPMAGSPSRRPWMVIVSVAVLVSPSASVIV